MKDGLSLVDYAPQIQAAVEGIEIRLANLFCDTFTEYAHPIEQRPPWDAAEVVLERRDKVYGLHLHERGKHATRVTLLRSASLLMRLRFLSVSVEFVQGAVAANEAALKDADRVLNSGVCEEALATLRKALDE